ncbi:MAG: type IX secretion system sortase PorU [candidate division Zixibacteria bacterium]|nr:type IX secretion system sortase PorU [candidate division Zixibacteria bacterium]
MEINRYQTIFVFFVVLATASVVLATDPNLTVLVSTDSEFRFRYDFAAELDGLPVTVNHDDFSALQRTIQIAIPAGSEVRLLSVTGEQERIDRSARALAAVSGSESQVDISRPVVVRGRTTVGIRVTPLQDGLVYDKVEVAVSFGRTHSSAKLTALDDPVFDRIWSASLANYDVAKHWPVIDRRQGSTVSLGTAGSDSLTHAAQWYKLIVSRTGLVRVTGAQLESVGINLGSLASDSIRVFNAGGLPDPVDNAEDRPNFQEISLLIIDSGDGQFDQNDQLLFYGEAPNRWVYDAGETPDYISNRYTDENVYWLAVSGSFSGSPVRMDQINGALVGPAVPVVDTYRNWVHIEQDRMISIEADGHVWDYYNWYWTDETSLSIDVATPGAIETDSAFIYTAARTNRSVNLSVNGTSATRIDCHSSACQHYTFNLQGGIGETNTINLQLIPLSSSVPPFLNYLDISYRSQLLPVSDYVAFDLDNNDAEVEVQVVDNFSSTPTVFDISDPLHPTVITGFDCSGGILSFRTNTLIDRSNRYFVAITGQAVSPIRIEEVDFTDLRTIPGQTDMFIVTTEDLAPLLDEYVAYRSGQGWSIRTVLVDDIMNDFSYGLYDPSALRDFFKFAYENYPSPAPSSILLVGDANYDYLDHLSTGVTNVVPSYIRAGNRTYSDDNYVYFGDFGILDSDYDRAPDMMTARWPVRTVSEINNIINKVMAYESPSNFGAWRTRVTLVADDEHTTDRHDETFHTTQTETLEKVYIPRLLNRNKIYLWDYPFVNREKPSVNEAIIKAFNDGSLIVNYVGHGNPDVWSHEHVLQRGADLVRLNNSDRLPLVYAASCDIGFFDDPQREGMAEDLLTMSSGGAVGVISATRLVYAADNAQFNRAVYNILFSNPDLTICEAMFAAKVERQYPNPLDTLPRPVDNDRAYNFLGDPCLRLGLPTLRLEFTEQPDSLVAAGISTISGRVVDDNGVPVSANGELQVSVYDSDRERSYRLAGDTNAIVYNLPGPTIFRGTASIVGGQFNLQFVTPLDVGYRGSSARVSAYAQFSDRDGIGLIDSILVSETQNLVEDTEGPTIVYSVSGRSILSDGARLSRDESLDITLSDPSGLNLVGGIGHGIVLVIDDQIESAINLTDLFEYDRDGYTSGTLVLSLAGIVPGPHRFKIKAWDNVNNASVVEFEAEIMADDRLAVLDLLNYPNPMNRQTTFYFGLSQPVSELRMAIYTLSGKNIWNTYRYQLRAGDYPNGSSDLTWDGRDANGNWVANGVYVYHLTARGEITGENVEEFGKVIVFN